MRKSLVTTAVIVTSFIAASAIFSPKATADVLPPTPPVQKIPVPSGYTQGPYGLQEEGTFVGFPNQPYILRTAYTRQGADAQVNLEDIEVHINTGTQSLVFWRSGTQYLIIGPTESDSKRAVFAWDTDAPEEKGIAAARCEVTGNVAAREVSFTNCDNRTAIKTETNSDRSKAKVLVQWMEAAKDLAKRAFWIGKLTGILDPMNKTEQETWNKPTRDAFDQFYNGKTTSAPAQKVLQR